MRHLPEQHKRVETGVTQFGDDWPGVFIRGDCAFGYAMYLRNFINNEKDEISKASVFGLLSLLESCDERACQELTP